MMLLDTSKEWYSQLEGVMVHFDPSKKFKIVTWWKEDWILDQDFQKAFHAELKLIAKLPEDYPWDLL